jgi:tetratricopeptide (TPR) repeat protein
MAAALPSSYRFPGVTATKEVLTLQAMYRERAAAAPANPFYPWALAELDDSRTQEVAEKRYRAAITIDPRFVKAYQGLAEVLAYRGDLTGERECLNKAYELQPDNLDALASYAQRVLEFDPELGRKLTDQLLRVWHHEAGSDLLARLAAFETDLGRRISTLEQLKAWYPATESDTTEWHMRFLFDAYNRTEPLRALALAQEMVLLMPPQSQAGRDWQALASYQETLMRARTLMERKNYAGVASELKKVAAPELVSADPQTLLHAQSLDLAGKTDQAYRLILEAMVVQPSDGLRSALAQYGAKNKKTNLQVESDLRSEIVKNTDKFPDFKLDYEGEKGIKFSELCRGRIVLLDLWHPLSVTAREDFPHLQKMLDKYGSKGFAIVTVNLQPLDAMANVIMSRYHFGALSAPDPSWAMRELRLSSATAPYYYLLDQKRRFVFRPQFGSIDSQHSFELMLQTLLEPEK